jgi:galactose mutarotase-like enzyme
MNHLFQITWHGQPAWALESERLRVVTVPSVGARLVSLFDRQANFEWLVGPQGPLTAAGYGASFVDQDLNGWDEMLPTINACAYPGDGPFAGRWLPDHGEVWSVPWQLDSAQATPDQASLVLSVVSRALPARLTRTIHLAQPDLLELQYRMQNLGPAPFHYIWAAHPQFLAYADTLIRLPGEVNQVINVTSQPPWGQPGQPYHWPQAIAQDQKAYRLDQVGPVELKTCRKFYLPPEQPVSWAALERPAQGCSLRLEWHPAELPYLGIWVDEGAFSRFPVVALEPTTGYYDSLALACQLNRAPLIEPGVEHAWTLRLRLGQETFARPPENW